MARERIDPVADEHGDEHHPAFGMISVHRITATPGEVLFQSDIRHPHYVRIEVHEATRKRDLKHDWVHPGRLLCEVSMSEAQFASFLASGGTEGVPCTVNRAGVPTGERPGLNLAPRLAVTSEEVRAAASEAYAGIKEAFSAYQEALAVTGQGSAAVRRKAIARLSAAIANAAPNVTHATRVLDEHAEAVVEKSRADIEVMMTGIAERLGIPAEQVKALEEGSDGEPGK